MNYLNDKHFLKNLQEQKNIKTRIKIYLLNFDVAKLQNIHIYNNTMSLKEV